MSDLLSQIQIVLQNGGYETWLTPLGDSIVVGFEDASSMGFCVTFDDAQSLIEKWKGQEDALLSRHALSLRRADEKVWNLYSVFLTSAQATDQQTREIRQIDENQERTRKIAACSVGTLEDITTALLPILPIQHQPRLDGENVRERLRRRVTAIAPAVADTIFDEAISPEKVVRLIGGGQ